MTDDLRKKPGAKVRLKELDPLGKVTPGQVGIVEGVVKVARSGQDVATDDIGVIRVIFTREDGSQFGYETGLDNFEIVTE